MERVRLNLDSLVPACTFLVLLAIGLLLFRDYGMSWDEEQSRTNGMVSAKYVLSFVAPDLITGELRGVPDLADYRDKDYGVGFELPAYAGERLLGLSTTQSIYFYRHFLTYLVFIAGVMATYGIATRRHQSWQAGLLAASLLYLSPRIFADGFYNTKDIVFMAAMALAAYTMLRHVSRPNFATATLHAAATAWALDIRVMAVLIVPATAFFLILEAWKDRSKALYFALLFVSFALAIFAIHVMTFPFLWGNPISHFMDVFRVMSDFSRWQGVEFYFGYYVDGAKLPWHYLPVWIAITTPPLVLFLFLIGVFRVRNGWDVVITGLALAPVAAVITLHSVQYDGWRHLYFIYPFMVLTGVNAALWIWSKIRGRIAAATLLAVGAGHFIFIITWMASAHPYQNVYFNMLAGRDPRQNFEMDYWGLANRAALEYILRTDPAPSISVAPASLTPLENSLLMLTEEQKARIHVVRDFNVSAYILTNYKWVDDLDDARFKSQDLYYHTDIDGMRILSVYHKKD